MDKAYRMKNRVTCEKWTLFALDGFAFRFESAHAVDKR
ncbi:hypothetical protein FHS18_005972 [Paenibacillus phyllosphaerae]|uniref:Uncharacterized protein n=1 Tax=Paenibacillus phyllosphaerae TaxID=274593 RepID=A0A7W5B3R6_9BACL|nr:hypothetical protein [Paenibacillus phyllosphaerae]